jgi:F-type H+-transporting ATPase subunit b
MDQTLRQLGELLLSSIPTILLFGLVYLGYRNIVHKPLMRVLEERYSRTQGAIEKARADVAAAEAKTAEYEQRLRESKLAIVRAQEQRLAEANAVRNDVLGRAREQAASRVAEARAALETDVKAARASLQGDAEKLAQDVISTILRPVALAQSPSGGAQ